MGTFKLICCAIALALTLLVFLLMPGCSAEKQLAKKIDKAKILAYQNPESFADLCARLFPVKDSIAAPEVIYTPADNKDYTQEIGDLKQAIDDMAQKSAMDTSETGRRYRDRFAKIYEDSKRLADLYRKCKPDTIRLKVTVYKENTARIASLGVALAQEQAKTKTEAQRANSAEITASKRGKINWYFGGASLLLLSWNFRRLLLPR